MDVFLNQLVKTRIKLRKKINNMFGPSLSDLVYKLTENQQLRLKTLLEDFEKEGLCNRFSFEECSIKHMIKDIQITIECNKKLKLSQEAANKEETTVPKSNWGVHETHCCSNHGCKYGHVDCPVTIELIKQEYPCEDCREQEEHI